MTREFVRDKQNLQREQKGDVPGWLTTFAYLTVLAIVIGILAALVVGLMRMDRDRERVRRVAGSPGTSGNGAPAGSATRAAGAAS